MNDRTLWAMHIASGSVIFILLGLHMALMHLGTTLGLSALTGGDPLEWASVAERMRSTIFAITYVLLLGAALYHGLYGLRNILLELSPRPILRRTVNYGLVLAGLALFVFGAWAALASLGSVEAIGG